ncbi:MAG: lysophospholipid acyltransferase family protein [Muribaculum sp.]|nr:lysophospholipid acyltransferase family protein [Muribaculaceae bacterium]MCM1080776.1 lysophospholipid acyltransferase family protein [Muribaculum sp.]
MENNNTEYIKPTVLDYNDIVELLPKAKGHKKLVNKILHWLSVDKVNDVHSRYCYDPGPAFPKNLLKDFDITLRVDNEQILQQYASVPFITVSNHPFGALDGISLIALVTKYCPTYKVMVNMVLNKIGAMRPNFIAVDALQSDDPEKKRVSMNGMRQAIKQVRGGNPIGFFPAGAVSKWNRRFQIVDRPWQPSIIRLIRQLDVPVIPIFFHGSNSVWFNILGLISWQLRTLRLPAEVWKKCHSTIRISIGQPITPEKIASFGSDDVALGRYLKQQTYALKN